MLLLGTGTFALAAIVAAAVGSSQNWGQDPEPAPSAAAAPPADNGPPALDGDEHQDHQDHEGLDDGGGPAAPDWSGLTYIDLHGAQLPVSPVHGPRSVSNAAASGFTRDEGGAALAAVHLASRVAPQVGPAIYGPNIERMQGDVSAMMAQVDADYAAARAASGIPDDQPLRAYGQTIGYAMPLPPGPETSEVTVHLLGRGAGPDGGEVVVAIPVTLVWLDGDWYLTVPPGARWDGQPVAGTAGYQLFPEAGAG
jgi:hypothetical protein